ncbi:nucleoside triphosphate pyrophosphatase [Nitrosomonas sp. Nm33]|uniref:Maf family protein n=1 Tax=Nitrosomonas sp. Nm33 TaxID=133724 RepID=UPI00089679FB|nr:Maf family protein [Nitrosomonas sp. Nm33]SDY28158.1 septum formation protein [Nitrosomonas sp. Nm33]
MTLAGNYIYLASRSPRRRELLKQIGVRHSVLLMREAASRAVDVDETPFLNESPTDYVYRITHAKAEAGRLRLIQRKLPLFPVLVADTIVTLDGCIFGKPRDAAHAEEMLAALSGRTHQVLTAIALNLQGNIKNRLSITTVRFRDIGKREIQACIASGEAFDKAGAYAIQGMAAAFIVEIFGSYSGVMGLPLFETAQLLEESGIKLFS